MVTDISSQHLFLIVYPHQWSTPQVTSNFKKILFNEIKNHVFIPSVHSEKRDIKSSRFFFSLTIFHSDVSRYAFHT